MIIGPLFAILAVLTAVMLVIRWMFSYVRFKRQSETQFELHTRLIDKFGTPTELVDYLKSDAGRAFLTPAPVEQVTPYRRILASAQAGVILTFVGGAVWVLRGSEALGREGVQATSAIGGITLALGLGFIASAILAYVLSSRWGLFDGKRTPTDDVR